MEKTADNNTMVISVPEGARVEVTDDGRTIKIIFDPMPTTTKEKDFDILFPIVPASKLSLEDDFMKHKPTTGYQKCFVKQLTKAIKGGLKDFRVSAVAPSFNAKGEIVYKEGNKPAVGKTANWWKEKLKGVMPKKRSQMGTKTEYVAFCGYIIKYLVSIGWKKGRAWRAVCDDRNELGRYINSENAKHDLESTGSRLIGVFYYNFKILKNDDLDGDEASGFVLAGGRYDFNSISFPLVDLHTFNDPNLCYNNSVGWLVMDV